MKHKFLIHKLYDWKTQRNRNISADSTKNIVYWKNTMLLYEEHEVLSVYDGAASLDVYIFIYTYEKII